MQRWGRLVRLSKDFLSLFEKPKSLLLVILAMNTLVLRLLAAITLSANLLFSPHLWAGKDLALLAAGSPRLMSDGVLPSEQYLPFEVRRLAKPSLIWANLPLLKKMGYDVPQQLDEATEKKILESLAWVAPDPFVQPDEITTESRTFFADFYGGWGIGHNHGSARAGSSGSIQSKGVGITPHLKLYDKDHTARSTLHEAIKDAVWGEVLNNELPYGGNQLVAIISRGGSLDKDEPQVIEIRVDPTRMGHFVTRVFGSDIADQNRARKSLSHLFKALPMPLEGFPDNATEGEKLVLRLLEYCRRIGVQYGHMYMKRLYHGATTESNIEISGRMIDFGTASAQPGYKQIQFLTHNSPFGVEKSSIEERLIQSLISNVTNPNLNAEIAELVTTGVAALQKRSSTSMDLKTLASMKFSNAYEETRSELALIMTGVPLEFVQTLRARHSDLGRALVRLTMEEVRESEIINLKEVDRIDDQPKGRLQALTNLLHALPSLDAPLIEAEISKRELITEPAFRQILSQQLADFFTSATQLAEERGMSAIQFRHLMELNSKFTNRPMEKLYLPTLRRTTKALTTQFMAGQQNEPAKVIGELVGQSLRTIKGLAWYEAPVLVSSKSSAAERDASSIQRGHEGLQVSIFNAITGRHSKRIVRSTEATESRRLPVTSRAVQCQAVFASQ